MSVIVVSDQPSALLSPKDPASSKFYYFDYSLPGVLASGEILTSAVITATNAADGTDNTPSMIVMAFAILNSNVIQQMITSGLLGDSYILKCVATTNLGQILTVSATLPIGPEYGTVS